MEGLKHGVDMVGAGIALASVLHALPEVLAAIASTLTIIWYTIRLMEWWRGRK